MTDPQTQENEQIAALTKLVNENNADPYVLPRTSFITLFGLVSAANAVISALQALGRIRHKLKHHEVRSLAESISSDISVIYPKLFELDLPRIKLDARYAGSLMLVASALQHCGSSCQSRGYALELFIESDEHARKASASLAAITDKSRPLCWFAVVKSNFTDTKGGTPVNFHEGEYCKIASSNDRGAWVVNGSFHYLFKTEQLQERFELVEC